MSRKIRFGVGVLLLLASVGTLVLAQPGSNPPAAKASKLSPPPPAGVVAVTVNGQAIPELAVYRVLIDEPPENHARAREEVLNYLIGNVLVDQYLLKIGIKVDSKDVDKKLEEMKKEAKDEKQDWNELLRRRVLTEDDLRQQLTCAMRWDAFVDQQASEKALRELFDKHRTIFDGSMVMARHILVTGNAEQARAKIAVIKKDLEAKVAAELAKLPAQASNLDKEKTRTQALIKAFAEAAAKESECPSKKTGGDLGWFPRIGTMVEPFARTAFELKPYQMSDAVTTEFGQHLILTVDHKVGKEVKFEDLRPVVKEVFAERLREALITNLRPRAQIAMQSAKN